jgi:carboxypeptidase T
MSTPRISAILLLMLLGLALPAMSSFAAEPHHALVQVQLDSPADDDFIRLNRGRLDVVYVKPGSFAHIAAKPGDLDFLRQAGLRVEVLQDDMEAANAYADKGIGYGIYHTWSETVAFVDSLRLLYPDVISEKWSIGQSVQGRDLWCFRISDNPDVDEDEPEVMIDAMHHAREIIASEFTIMFAEYLAQNYGTDPEITWLVNNRELYIVPVVNPDGSVYNEGNYPNGGGMWRKNRRNNMDGSYGVDPNRNYPYMWGYDNNGSSPDPDSETYRGPSGGSEPEVQALMNFINSREIRTHDTIHSHGNLTLIPWGYTSSPTPDGALFDHMADEMVKFNGYVPGQPHEAINYPVNGGTFDWAYGDQTFHDKIYSFSNEIGNSGDGFWPEENRREPLFQENIWPHIYLMRVAGAFVAVHSPVVTAGAKSIDPGQTGTLDFTIENQSVFDGVTDLEITIGTDDPWVHLGGGSRTIGSLGTLSSTTLAGDPIAVTVDADCPGGHLVNFSVTVHMTDGDLVYNLGFTVGSPVEIFSDDMESGLGNWTTTGTWGLTTGSSHSPTTSLTDSPSGEYPDLSFTTATLNGTYQATALSFWHRYTIENNYDYGRVQVSAEGGAWTTLASYTGSQSSWQQVDIDLSPFTGQNLTIRFVMETDYSVTEDGWYIDDVVLAGNPGQGLTMAPPAPVSPLEGETVGSTPTLIVTAGTKDYNDTVLYGFRIYSDELLSDLVAGVDNIPEAGSETSWTAPALANGDYWWRAWAGDGAERTLLNQPVGFIVDGVSAVEDVVIGGPGLRVLGNVTGSTSRLELSLPGQADVSVVIHDARGARVRQLYTGSMAGGTRVLVWDGRNNRGQSVASGVYFVRMNTGRETLTDRVVIVR